MARPKITAVANQKGGVGKKAAVYNLIRYNKGAADESKNSAETRRCSSRIINPETEKDGIYHPLKV
ncbi:MAG: hypothetical protein HFF17_10455 [Oscillospiraceae bacterium]|nr:hypothetical protein [Oscillospiraceae bacterium]